jgi:thioredoxin-dependent peroxiredoxin
MTIRIGERAPDFTLPGQDGSPVRLRELLGKGPVVVYFYPRDESPICTAEACAFRDAYEDFKAAGAEVVGISSDSTEEHAAFAKHRRLPFLLASDQGGQVRDSYGVRAGFLGLLAGRVTFVLDAQGTVRHVFDSALNAVKHVQEALEVLRRLQATAEHASAEMK